MATLRLQIPMRELNWQRGKSCADCLARRLRWLPAIRDVSLHVQAGELADVRLEYDDSRIDVEQLEAWVREQSACRALATSSPTPNGRAAVGDDFCGSHSPATVQLPETPAVPGGGPGREPLTRWLLRQPVLMRVLAGGVLLLGATLTHLLHGPEWLRAILLGISFACTVPEIGRDAVKSLAKFRISVDTLMFLAAFGAMALGHWEEGGLLLFLFALGREGERLAMRRARAAIQMLGRLTPETAIRISADGREAEVPIEDLAVGDLVRILPFDRVPADAVVLTGTSEIDQSSITGESVPVAKQPGDSVFAGTMNSGGGLTARVEKPASESTIGRILKLVEEAQQSQSPTQRMTARFEANYVPLVLVLTAFLIAVPHIFTVGETWDVWFYRAMAFLTAAAPGALAIGTPAAVLCGIARSARAGILIKGGAYLEILGTLKALAFDKTGTLTVGRPSVREVLPLAPAWGDGREALRLAAAVEAGSSHPLADAVHTAAVQRGLAVPPALGVQQIPGRGARGRVEGHDVVVGRREMLREVVDAAAWDAAEAKLATLLAGGCTLVLVAVDGQLVVALGLADELRPTAYATMQALQRLGVEQRILLTGDLKLAAEPIAKQLEVNACYAELLPEQKVKLVRELREQHGTVAMIGDGVNDAPALADATVGIAMGGAGRDIAMETADVVLMGDAIEAVPKAIAISRFSRRVIVQNLFLALGTIAVVAPAAALGYVPLGLAVAFHEGSTVLVVLNALRILGYRGPTIR